MRGVIDNTIWCCIFCGCEDVVVNFVDLTTWCPNCKKNSVLAKCTTEDNGR